MKDIDVIMPPLPPPMPAIYFDTMLNAHKNGFTKLQLPEFDQKGEDGGFSGGKGPENTNMANSTNLPHKNDPEKLEEMESAMNLLDCEETTPKQRPNEPRNT